MSDAQFQTFMTGGLLVLVVGVLAIAWLLWRQHEHQVEAINRSVEGVSSEYRMNLQRALAEFGSLARGEPGKPSMLLPGKHPMLDMVNTQPFDIDRVATSRLTAGIEALEATRLDLRASLARGGDSEAALSDAMEAGIDAIIGLYLWEVHRGVTPDQAHSTRSRSVRDWMKAHHFDNTVYPGKNLRDEVIQRLRDRGMTLTPKPLNLTASEYWARRYDRYADPRAPFGRRKPKAMPEQAPLQIDAEIVEEQAALPRPEPPGQTGAA
ncbi:MAG: hypothetical protein AAFX02_08460 [Pseudomonadota bacterium]